jgi:transcription-repair coupling factor (superfamily II helicase)
VLADMRSGKPMDRLVCGDVGFGKTEVALRAAFAAVASGKQVVILTPTTLLAEQHFQTFSDRFADWPVRIAELSRLRSAKEQKEALAGLAEGRIDIAIGTHRLLQPDVRFARLGLVIIDEEHRFGVRQKEAMKRLRQEVDVLTLTATPIPRTLGMALEGLRDFSVIATAPQKRLAVKTFVAPRSEGLIREAVLREFKRGGQVYFVHNEVRTIENVREELERLLPMARIVVGHGQMSERELERVMRDFTHQRANLLLCTTIIETGIDIPTANTILIDRADRFGLAQLHQLRGRVGRSHHQAYAYLLTDPHVKPSAQAQKRLEAIAQLEDLGSGFYLAMHDLEIRGAGEVLGEEQSGEIQRVGFSLYSRMLEEAVRRLKSGQEPGDLTRPFRTVAEINLHAPALLPDDYCPDVSVRLELYKRLADADSDAALQELTEELVDRFGPLPPQTRTLVATHRLRIALAPCGVAKVDASEKSLSVQFSPDAPIDPAKVVALIQRDRSVKMAGPDRLVQTRPCPDVESRVRAVRELVARVLSPQAAETV